MGDRLTLMLACAVVISVYAAIACHTESETSDGNVEAAYYNRLSDGFRQGHLYMAQEPPAGLVALPDPYDPEASKPFRRTMYSSGRVHDLSFYRGRLYLYFSAVPALVLFLPFRVLTGEYLSHQLACVLFCSLGFLAEVALFQAIWRRFFPGVPAWATAACAVGIGLAPIIPVVLVRPDVWEVPICCSFALAMLSLVALWRFLCLERRRWVPALALSASIGLGIACRPSSALESLFLLVPVFVAARSLSDKSCGRGEAARILAASILPIALIGACALWYNVSRFGKPLEFGQSYMLSGKRATDIRSFGLDYFWYNVRMYFFQAPGLSLEFPFVRPTAPPKAPMGYSSVEYVAGLIPSVPFILGSLALPLAFSRRPPGEGRLLASIVLGIIGMAAAVLAMLIVFCASNARYEMEFTPAIVFFSAVGILALENRVRPLPGRFGIRAAWLALLALSVATNLLTALVRRGQTEMVLGLRDALAGSPGAAEVHLRNAVWDTPSNWRAHAQLAQINEKANNLKEACAEYEAALRYEPNSPPLHYRYSVCLFRLDRYAECKGQLEAALALRPDFKAAEDALDKVREVLGEKASGRSP